MKLDFKKPFGTISGDTFIPEGCDTPARYEQDGKFFDAHGGLILPKGSSVTAVGAEAEDDLPELDMTVADLIMQAETMPWRQFKRQAAKALGPDCPATKAGIIEHLHAVQKEFDARATKRNKERGLPPPRTSNSTIDLAAWGRGQKEYLWGDVRKAIKAEFGRNVSERDDAVDFLIQQEVITAESARQDVIRTGEEAA